MLQELKSIDKRIASIRVRGGKLRDSIAECAVLIVIHAKDHGDCSRALALCGAVPMASERVKLIQWFAAVSPIKVSWAKDAKDRKVGLSKTDAKTYNPFDVDMAKAVTYFDYGKSDDEQTVALLTSGDINEVIVKLANRLQTKLDDGKVAANDTEVVGKRIASLRLLTVAA